MRRIQTSRRMLACAGLVPASLVALLCGCAVSPGYEANRHAEMPATTGSLIGGSPNSTEPAVEHNMSAPGINADRFKSGGG